MDIDKQFYRDEENFKIYLINDFKFRNTSLDMDEFGGFASRIEQPIIPENEIWVSKYYEEKEIDLFIKNSIVQHSLMQQGLDRWAAYDESLDVEHELRVNKYNAPEYLITLAQNIPADLEREFYMEIENVKVFLVDGFQIRNYFKTDFVCGGHGYVYSWIPKDEIWLEKQSSVEELPYTLMHEFVERTLMKVNNGTYPDTHPIASKVEFSFRPDKLLKENLINLTEEETFKIINNILKT
ncbi:MAG: hypothetical protein ACMG57_04515 [Candidatus Dojkabacteria bacterium]